MGMPAIPRREAERRFAALTAELERGLKPPGIPCDSNRGERGALREAYLKSGVSGSAADKRGASYSWLEAAERALGRKFDWTPWLETWGADPPEERPEPAVPKPVTATTNLSKSILGALRQGGQSTEDLAARFGVTPGTVYDAIVGLKAEGANIDQAGNVWRVHKSLAPAFVSGELPTYISRPDNTYLFGALGDSHLGSKYERLDVLNDLYDIYEREGADRVFHTGNWIDGVAPFNVHDLNVHGLEPQLRYLAENYPKRSGLVTHAVTGEDHEGWFARREGIDVGRRAQQTMRDHGREDWVDLGFMESHVRLVNANSGKEAIAAVVHPGGGTAYALSYSVQKIIEALEGGEKPAVALYGHYHKLWAGSIRNVWVVCTGAQQDQTIFTRNKIKQEVHVGGTLVKLHQDPETGAIVRCVPELMRYFAKGFYNNRWSKSGAVTLVPRRVA